MKRYGWLAITVLIVGLVLLLGQRFWRPVDASWARIRQEGVLRVSMDASFPPFAAVGPDGAVFGFDVELAEALASRLGVQAVIENITYDALLPSVASGRNDAVISAFVPDLNQLDDVAYTPAYFVNGVVIVTAPGAQFDAAAPWRWAAGQHLAVEYGAMGDVLVRDWRRRSGLAINLTPYATAAEALDAVAAGQADAALVDALSAYAFLKTVPDLAVVAGPYEPEPYAIAVGADSPELLQALTEALAALEADGTLRDLRMRWLGVP
jgi:ABC-type amino acid transport substrate-binding protein